MGRKITIGFWHDIDDFDYWKDGLWAAMEILKARHNVRYNAPGDVNLVWTGSQGHAWDRVEGLNNIIWLYAGGIPTDKGVTTIVEDEFTQAEFNKLGVDAPVIFGTNVNLFYPIKFTKKYDIIFPAAFASWKRHKLLTEWAIKGLNVLCVGYKQQVETECYKVCEEAGFEVMDRVKPEVLAQLYNQSRECWIPTSLYGGSQRTVLEARACGLPVRVADDNPRLQALLQCKIPSHYEYAHKLDEVIFSTT